MPIAKGMAAEHALLKLCPHQYQAEMRKVNPHMRRMLRPVLIDTHALMKLAIDDDRVFDLDFCLGKSAAMMLQALRVMACACWQINVTCSCSCSTRPNTLRCSTAVLGRFGHHQLQYPRGKLAVSSAGRMGVVAAAAATGVRLRIKWARKQAGEGTSRDPTIRARLHAMFSHPGSLPL